MILLGLYDELGPGMGYPSMREYFDKEPFAGKEKIISYLKSGKIHMVTASIVKDVFTGENAGYSKVFMDDGEYSWSSSIIHYVDKYNLRLPVEFENKVNRISK